MRHDDKSFGQAILILNEVGEHRLGAKSEILEYNLRGLSADRHPGPKLLQAPRPRDGKNFSSENPANAFAPVGG